MDGQDILSDLIAFPTVSADPNIALITYCADLLRNAGARVQVIEEHGGTKANLFATVGPDGSGGVVLSGHTDVVPVAGQAWSVPAFEATLRDGRIFGRGTTDMKGFVACAMAAMLDAAKRPLRTPLHLALSYDEEVGCLGVRSLIDMLKAAPFRPRLCIVGEPTGMGVATGHKGKMAFDVVCTGVEAHSALAPTVLNAIHLACDMIRALRDIQEEVLRAGPQDPDYDIANTTLHVGTIEGGGTLNIVPNRAEFTAEIRNLAQDDPEAHIATLRARADALLRAEHARFPEAKIEIVPRFSYPALDTPGDAEAVRFVQSLTGANDTFKVAYGTEAGRFDQDLGLPTVVCGPGFMAQGHKPDEFVSVEQLHLCKRMLDGLLDWLETPQEACLP